MEYNHKEIEASWQKYWEENQTYKVEIDTSKPKFYALDMFPYPSGAGLHVGHPLGYIASDIVARYKTLKGFNVLHPIGFDAFGLPAEQYAIETGQHPAITTAKNIDTYKKQLRKIGFNYDWSREVQTCEPAYYKWTQWIFAQLFNAWYDYADAANNGNGKAKHIDLLVQLFENQGNEGIKAACDEDTPSFSAQDWKDFSEKEKSNMLLKYRMTFLSEAVVNWCPAMGTVLANDEVKDGFSERGGFPVERKKMKQWMMRITAYSERLLAGLEKIDWSEALKESQRNWIGKSYGAELDFKVVEKDITLTVFTTRIDTTFGVTFVSIAPEHELIPVLTSPEQKEAVEEYVNKAKNRSERDRMADVKTVSGVFTGSYVINPFSGEKIELWVADYVLAGYGTGVVMAVPSSDDRDFRFAKHFGLPIIHVIEGTETLEDPTEKKKGKMINSGFLNGLESDEAIQVGIKMVEEKGIGKGKINFRIRDAVFSRQRYWGEPVPVYFKNDIPYLLDNSELPLVLPEIDEYKPTETGEPPLGRAKDWKHENQYSYELSTMPGWAGSSWYFLRYMDAQNEKEFVSKEAVNYWKSVDLYIGGTEHAVGHLLYSRFWNLALYDLGFIGHDEPFQKLINQGMIQGVSQEIIRTRGKSDFIIRKGGMYNLLERYPNANPATVKWYYIAYSANKFKHLLENSDIYRSFYIPSKFIEYSSGEEYGALTKEGLDKLVSETESTNFNYKEVVFNCENGFWIFEQDRWIFRDYNGVEKDSDFENFITLPTPEKMSKSKYNVVNPDEIVERYGADTLRLYEMFLGPLEQSKPWSTKGIDGTYKFLKKLWKLFYDDKGNFSVSAAEPTKAEYKTLHKTIKKVAEDIERHSFNTTVSAFMICVNELTDLKCNKASILNDLLIILSPYAPHIAEELWAKSGHTNSITKATFPTFNEEYLKESTFEYPISINGKMRAKMEFPVDKPIKEIEEEVLNSEAVKKWTEGKPIKKMIVVQNKIVNVVV